MSAPVRRKTVRFETPPDDPIVFDLDPSVYDGLASGELTPIFAKNPGPPPGAHKLVPIPASARSSTAAGSSSSKRTPAPLAQTEGDNDVASTSSRKAQIGGSSSSSRPPPAVPYGGSTSSKAKAPLTAQQAAHQQEPNKEEKAFPDFDPLAGLYPEGPPGKEDFSAHVQADRLREYGVIDPLPPYVRASISFQKENSASSLIDKNRRNARWLLKFAEKTKEANEAVMKSLKPHPQAVYQGKNFVLRVRFRNTGKIDPCGFWKRLPYDKIEAKKKLAASTQLEQFRKHPAHEHWAEEPLIETMWRQKEAMAAKGLWREAKPDEVGCLGASKAFPVVQGNPPKVRTCIDYRAQNNTLVVEEKMRLLNARAAMHAIQKFLSPLRQNKLPPDVFQFRQTINADVMSEKLIREQISIHKEISAISAENASSRNVHEQACETRELQERMSISDDESFVFNPYHSKDDLEQFYYQSGSFDPKENAVWMPVPYSVSDPAPSDNPIGPPDVNATPASSSSSAPPQATAQPRDPVPAPRPQQQGQPRKRSWQLILSLVALFGSLSSVHECVAVSECLQAIIARFQIFGTVYIDDIHLMSRPTVAASDQEMIHLLLLLLGWRRSSAKHESMHNMIQKCLVVLGVSYTWISESEIVICIDAKKIAELIALGTRLLLDAKIEMKSIERFRGLYRHCLQLSRSQARTIIHCYTDAALENLEGLNAAIASGQRDLSQFKMFIGGFLYVADDDQRAFRGVLTSLPPGIHKMNIGILESLAARVAVDLWSAVMTNHFVVLHVDNLGDVFALARNSARCDITQNLVAAFHNIQYEKSLQVYTTWICTERNAADVLTREVRAQVLSASFPNAAVQELTLEQLHQGKIWNANSATTSGPSSCLA
eukprot:g19316.t1